ncbi:carbohydrate ABC transporter permease [Microbacterium sp. MPKO10]|uniref:carbohydrate ABC transporter permease n=1 Tax=Microbacterium sp. MPKO10 TaxID=2989818 RepID=UPI0022360806|nr:carbohydrate ABC transporter permease [Microbacterium sp. MPKO10]MCW4459807.1 carbohydrate ABC transporter permease [Microbacterium sp. MPKO10]
MSAHPSTEMMVKPHPPQGVIAKLKNREPIKRPIWQEKPSLAVTIGKFVTLIVVTGAVLFPLWTIVLTSLSTQEAINAAGGLVIIPNGLTISAYVQILSGGVVSRAVGVTMFITLAGTAISVIVSILAAWGLSRPGSLFHRTILFMIIITMFFSAGIIPMYLLVSGLGLINSLWALILPTAVSAFNILIVRNFFMSIDQGIIDSARIDGAGEWRILATIVAPMSKAVIAVIALFYGVGFFNAFFNAILYINDNDKWPLQLVLRAYVLQGQSFVSSGGADTVALNQAQPASLAIQMAVVVLAVVPILLVYPFVQRHFKSGILIGAIKG